VPRAIEAEEAGAAAAGASVAASSWAPLLETDVEQTPAEEEMREAGAREVCEETRGVGGGVGSQQHCSGTQGNQRQPQNERDARGMGSSGRTSR
jgi:hypothetical protein